jgi:hypothetical protein
VVVSYMYRQSKNRGDQPAGVHCAGARECGVDQGDDASGHVFDWTLCPLYSDFAREGFLPP